MHSVLVAEDDVYLREAYVTILKSAQYKVSGVENGKYALASIEDSTPDVLLLDMLMPLMNGLELLEELSTRGMLSKMRIIAFTNLSDRDTLEKLKGYGVDKYLLKSSVLPSDLINAIEDVVKKKATV